MWKATLALHGYKAMEIVEKYLNEKSLKYRTKHIESNRGIRIARYYIGLRKAIVISIYPKEECDVSIPEDLKDLIEILKHYVKVMKPKRTNILEQYAEIIVEFNEAIELFNYSSTLLLIVICFGLIFMSIMGVIGLALMFNDVYSTM